MPNHPPNDETLGALHMIFFLFLYSELIVYQNKCGWVSLHWERCIQAEQGGAGLVLHAACVKKR